MYNDPTTKSIMNINSYINDGFKKVCDVVCSNYSNDWTYKNIDRTLMFSSHRSWVYFIVEDETIVKCGETGNPLGCMEQTYSWFTEKEYATVQPKTGSKSRFGRLRTGDGTDKTIRESLNPLIRQSNKKVSLWAKKCETSEIELILGGRHVHLETTFHKELESYYLNRFKSNTGTYPRLNKSSK
jgi:hypothetical protein